MIYLNTGDIQKIGIDWNETINVIEKAVRCLEKRDFSQPVKPYLRYRDLKNRIIAMPAFIGGEFNVSGIKWIASFPDNINKSIPRAHSVVILNNADTGKPEGIVNTALLSIIRTASVSGLVLKYFDIARTLKNFSLGIIGWGPVGMHHFKMCTSLFGDRISTIYLYDIRPIEKDHPILAPYKEKVVFSCDWKEVYEQSDVFITCTVSKETYIEHKPKQGSLQMNISLRDYKPDIYEYVKESIIVDDWDEVCRENTDIEVMSREKGLKEEDTRSIIDIVCNECMKDYDKSCPIMFNPMGMAVFDISIGSYYMNKALNSNIGVELE
ncbi:ornithine cyclodeaminase [Pseudobacteroides cellulosolvens]|uniref:Ornithine cyclodeaminase/mu-crystallin n=1 Tax=Pseudobacteroides cellulosolvens ATCC 35603 = DSM 2933 TaxID=398512 RepID=A0A0L6JLZ4_9FIRM|nr:ornithine cyclodeaminase [Pseudobacteroides cellulosolvens]KNY26427.1 ornithine cyclodeaminase/mu-crystallin [Pseudobacteroides cellulosolvens ATCC 35603 = DSM 2933]